MKFEDLLTLPYDHNTGKIEQQALLNELPHVPIDVATQFLADHARKDSYQEYYSWLDLSNLLWVLELHTASDLVTCRYNPNFKTWVGTCTKKGMNVPLKGWQAIDSRKSVQMSWKEHRSWEVPPVFIRKKGANRSCLELVEGHSRIGCLIGLMKEGEIQLNSNHTIWCATYS